MEIYQPHQVVRAVELARENLSRGMIREPRVFFSTTAMPTSTNLFSQAPADVFRNGEEYPVRIHAMTAAVVSIENATDERQIQRVGMRMMFHDQYYMQRDFVPLPLWHNRQVAAAAALNYGVSHYKCITPFIYSARDSMDVRAELRAAPAVSRLVTFSMTGVGMDSKRPYFKADTLTFTAAQGANAPQPFNPEDLRNDGDEPILITDFDLHCSANTNTNNPQGDISLVNASIRQIGNGTQAVWMNGTAGSNDMCPAVLLGLTTGRALVHVFPGDGLLWEPGEGLRIELQPLNTTSAVATCIIGIALHGTIEVR